MRSLNSNTVQAYLKDKTGDGSYSKYDIVYECEHCTSEITVSDEDIRHSLMQGQVVITTCPECGKLLKIEIP